MCLIDLSKAYDSVGRELAWCLLQQQGAPAKLVGLLRDLHECAMQTDHKGSQSWFEVSTGFKQGDVNAPMLLNAFLDSIFRRIEHRVRHVGMLLIVLTGTTPSARDQPRARPAGF